MYFHFKMWYQNKHLKGHMYERLKIIFNELKMFREMYWHICNKKKPNFSISSWFTLYYKFCATIRWYINFTSLHTLRKKHKIRMLLRNCKTILQLDLFCKKKERINGTESALFPFLAREVYNRTHFSLSSLRVLTLFCTTPLSRI